MKIGLNGQNLFTKYPAGPEVFTRELYKNLAKIDRSNEYTVYLISKPTQEEWEDVSLGNENFKYKVLKKYFSWGQISLFLELLFHRVDVYFSPTHTLPGLAQIFSFKTKFIVMIHGLEYLINQMHVNLARQVIHKPIVLNWIVNTAHKIIVPSKSTKNSLLKMYPKSGDKMVVITEGVNEKFYKRNYDEVIGIKSKFGLSDYEEYLFFISTIQPRKNIPVMVKAFANFIKSNDKYKDLKLLIAGKKGWNFEESLDAPERYEVQNNVKFIGRVDDEDIPPLLSGAKALINMSLDEGFSLTVLEAMACSTNLMISDIPAHREIAGSYGNYADPYKPEQITELIKKVLDHPDPKKVESALFAARTYTWENTAQRMLDIFTGSYAKYIKSQ